MIEEWKRRDGLADKGIPEEEEVIVERQVSSKGNSKGVGYAPYISTSPSGQTQ
jgi:hypothetical protein